MPSFFAVKAAHYFHDLDSKRAPLTARSHSASHLSSEHSDSNEPEQKVVTQMSEEGPTAVALRYKRPLLPGEERPQEGVGPRLAAEFGMGVR